MEFREISVIVQGDIDLRYIQTCLDSLQQYLPGAEIILSTWKKEKNKLKGLHYDFLVLSDDPGAVLLNKQGNTLNNVNRQIVSTQAGLNVVKRKYVFKFRSNMRLMGTDFLNLFSQYAGHADLFEKKILIADYFTRNPRVFPMPFHPSDWILFGLTSDVKKYYQIPLQTDADGLWFKTHENYEKVFRKVYARFTPEQYICLNFLRKYYNVHCRSYTDITNANIIATECFLARNMVIADTKKHGFEFMKYNPNRYYEKSTILSFRDWIALCRHYAVQNHNKDQFSWLYYKCCCLKRKVVYFYVRGLGVKGMRLLKLDTAIKHFIDSNR